MTDPHRSIALGKLVSFSACIVALATNSCGGSDEPGADSADFEALELATHQGLVGPSPAGSSCNYAEYVELETLDAESRVLTWDYCGASETGGLHEPQRGERVLTDEEFAAVLDLLANVTPSDAKTCGADAPVITLDVETAASTKLYANDFYADCPWEVHDGRTFAKGVAELQVKLVELARD